MSSRSLRLLLVAMPWHGLDYPSLALGILRRRAEVCKHQPQVDDLYANLRWGEYLFQKSDGRITPIDYTTVADDGFFHGVGDWIFASALHGVENWKEPEYRAFLGRRGVTSADIIVEMQALAPSFIDEIASEVLAQQPDIVGFTTTFMQNCASLALARKLKEGRGTIKILFGGGNCEGVQGDALHRNFEFIDYVISGEAEYSFVRFLDAMNDEADLSSIPGLSYRSATARGSSPPPSAPVDVGDIPAPVYDSYFQALEESALKEFIQPKIVVESSRGCWWGQKHHCTFCGLNGSLMTFRRKSAERMWGELSDLVRKHKCLDLIMVDNIMDMDYFGTLLPQLASSGWDLSLHYELKSNLSTDQVRALRDAHIVDVQPGIEALNSRVLELMRKGVSGTQNVRLLRDCEEYGITASWNYLFGFPGELDSDYSGVIEQIPALVHLQPPNGTSRIALERFSPNFNDPSLGFPERRPAEFYSYIYKQPAADLEDMVYLFDCPPRGIGAELEGQLLTAIATWRELYSSSSLTFRQVNGHLRVRDRRANRPLREIVFELEWQCQGYLALMKGLSLNGLHMTLDSQGFSLSTAELGAWLAKLVNEGLVFEDRDRFVALATHDVPARLN